MALLIRSRLIDKVGAKFVSMVIRGNSKKELHDAFYKLFFMNDLRISQKEFPIFKVRNQKDATLFVINVWEY